MSGTVPLTLSTDTMKVPGALCEDCPGRAALCSYPESRTLLKATKEGFINIGIVDTDRKRAADMANAYVEQTRKLIESDEVLLLFNQLGTPTTMSVIKYVNAKKVPQLFIAAGATVVGDHKTHAWLMGFQPSYQSETHTHGNYPRDNYPNGMIAVLASNDDFGRDNVKGLKDGIGDAAANIVAEGTYETSAPTIDSEPVKLKFSGANIFVNFASAKSAAQAIKKAAEIGWKPVHILHGDSQSISAVLSPAGLENAKDIITASYIKHPADAAWKDDHGLKRFSDAEVRWTELGAIWTN